jgi:predicted CoA-substrate-specific enzyme activase
MITIGVDAGIENIKAVVLKDGQVLARTIGLSGGAGRGKAAEAVWHEAVELAGLTPAEIQKTVATGQGKYDVKIAADHVVEPVADARAARFLYPSARSVVDIGADQVRVMTLDDRGKITEVAMNVKCAAGLGVFLKSMARLLGMSIDEMSALPAVASQGTVASDSCCVFAELDVIALVHNNTPKPQIVQAINEAVATRINAVLNDKIPPDVNRTVLIGGVMRNAGMVSALKKRSGVNFLIPDKAQFAGALGAALIAAD